MQSIENLVSTINNQNIDLLLKNLNLQNNAIIINQNQLYNKLNSSKYTDFNIKLFSSKDVGLSKSRNQAINESNSDICILTDDDMVYVDQYTKIVLKAFDDHPEFEIIAFKVEGIEKKFKNYSSKPFKVNYLSSFKLSSVQIAFRRKKIIENNLFFDERFGAGSLFTLGEENIFLFDCLKKGLKILFLPLKIASVHLDKSTWFEGYNKSYFFSKGAAFYRMSKFFFFLYILYFAIFKHNLYKNQITFLNSIFFMLQGVKSYKSL